jgi:tripartite-type tricarboxylate transporter receptor subunit TctC
MKIDYPGRPVRIIVPLPQGGPADVLARAVGQKLFVLWGVEVTVENAVGGDTIAGTSMVAKADPDGYTLLVVPSQFTVHPRQRSDLPYDVIKDFAPVILMALGPNVLVVHPSVPANSIQELITLAKSKPGMLKYATGGPSSTSHVTAEKLKALAGIDIATVHYKGAAPATAAILAGETDMLFSVMAPTVPHVQAGKLRALAVTGPNRSRAIPDCPTMKESGFPDLEITTWQGLLAPADTAPEIIKKLNRDVVAVLKMQDVQQKLSAQGFELVGSTPEEFSGLIKREVQKTI